MKITVYKVYDDNDWENSTWHYEYATTDKEAESLEKLLTDIPYRKKQYNSVVEFIEDSEEIKDDTYSDGEALDFVLETLSAIGV